MQRNNARREVAVASRPATRLAGSTLLELMLATSLVAIALVSTLQLMRDGLTLSREVEMRSLLTTLCVSKLEEHMSLAAATWTTASASDSFATEGYSNVRFDVTRSDDPSDGGISDRLMVVTATTWEDEDGDTALDSDELQVTFVTKIAKLALYQDEASTP